MLFLYFFWLNLFLWQLLVFFFIFGLFFISFKIISWTTFFLFIINNLFFLLIFIRRFFFFCFALFLFLIFLTIFSLLSFPFLLSLWIFDRINDKCDRSIICNIYPHLLAKCSRKNFIWLSIQICSLLEQIIVKYFSLITLHSIMKVWLCSFKLMIECKLRNKE